MKNIAGILKWLGRSMKYFCHAVAEGLPNVLLTGMFLLVLCSFVFVLIEAYYDLILTNQSLERVWFTIHHNIEQHLVSNNDTLTLQAQLKEISHASKGLIDSNTISFLFQIFSIALVGAGAYLLKLSFDNSRKSKLLQKNILPLTHQLQLGDFCLGRSSYAYQAVAILFLDPERSGYFIIPYAREFFQKLLSELENARNVKNGIEPNLRTSLMDGITYSNMLLNELVVDIESRETKAWSENVKGGIKDIKEILDKILQLLNNPCFEDSFNRTMDLLGQ